MPTRSTSSLNQITAANRASDLEAIHVQLDTLDHDLTMVVGEVKRQSEAIGAVNATTQVLNANDANLASRIHTIETEFKGMQDSRFQLARENEQAHANLANTVAQLQATMVTQISGAVQAAMRDVQTVEQRSSDRERADKQQESQNFMQVIVLIAGFLFLLISNLIFFLLKP